MIVGRFPGVPFLPPRCSTWGGPRATWEAAKWTPFGHLDVQWDGTNKPDC